jgi:hypothetical protein
VSWRPTGGVLEAIVALDQADRDLLTVQQASLSAHFDWGVGPNPIPGAALPFTRHYFSSVVEVHDPRLGLPLGWVMARGEVARHAAYKDLFQMAVGTYPPVGLMELDTETQGTTCMEWCSRLYKLMLRAQVVEPLGRQ